MIPAACYPVYSALAARGAVPASGYLVNVEADCFRREPSLDPIRIQSFHMQELVHVGRPGDVLAFRDRWLESGLALFSAWGLAGTIEPADDPFLGRAAVVMARSQRQQALKFELQLPITDPSKPTACMSANYHLDSFGRLAGLVFADGTPTHSVCAGFGFERIALALFRHHGTTLEHWPGEVRDALSLAAPETASRF
ncbi:MAG TPA: hypothetical protein VKQ27_03835 [Acetobacteraceae bacterium]|nr:hypothetical protein [Acetobacteraceae bacterium]